MIIFLYGEDSFRSRKKLNELKEKFKKEIDPSGNSLTVIDGASAKLEEINEQISPSSFLVKKRMIIVEDIFQNKQSAIFEDLLNLLEKKSQSENIIIFWDSSLKTNQKGKKEEVVMPDSTGKEKALLVKPKKLFEFLRAQKFAQEFKALSNTDIATWVKKETEARGGKISYQAVNLLVSLVGSDLWQINNEVEKLINYKAGSAPKLTQGGSPLEISSQDIELLVRGSFDENIFALTDAISNKNKSLVAKLLEEEFESGVNDSYLMTMIIRQFKILLQIRVSLDQGQTSRKIISTLGLHPFVVQKSINQVRNFQLPQLKNIFSRLVKIDSQIKTGKNDLKTMLNILISEL